MLMLGAAPVAGAVTAAKNTPSKNEVGRAVIGADVAARAAATVAETSDSTLTNLEFRCVRYHMGPEFYIVAANVLSGGQNLNYGFLIILFRVTALFLPIIMQPLKDFQYQLNN